MSALLDTNACTALFSGDKIAELYDGFSGGSRYRENMEIIRRFREKPRTVCVPITDSTAEWFAEIKQILKKKGRPIPINDVCGTRGEAYKL